MHAALLITHLSTYTHTYETSFVSPRSIHISRRCLYEQHGMTVTKLLFHFFDFAHKRTNEANTILEKRKDVNVFVYALIEL